MGSLGPGTGPASPSAFSSLQACSHIFFQYNLESRFLTLHIVQASVSFVVKRIRHPKLETEFNQTQTVIVAFSYQDQSVFNSWSTSSSQAWFFQPNVLPNKIRLEEMRQSVREAEAGQALHGGQGGQAGRGGHSGQAASRKKVCLHFFVGASRKTSNCTGCSANFQHSKTSSTRFEKRSFDVKDASSDVCVTLWLDCWVLTWNWEVTLWSGADTLHPKVVERSREELRVGIQVRKDFHLFFS